MGDIASQSRWEIDSATQGNKRLKRVESSQVSSDASREAQTAQGEDRTVGSTFKPGAIKGSFTVFVEKGTPEVDYRALFWSGEYFSLTRNIVDGASYQYTNVQVSSLPNVSGDNQGSHKYTVDWIAQDELPL